MLSQASKTHQGQGRVDLLKRSDHSKFVSKLSEFCKALLDLFEDIACSIGIKIGSVCVCRWRVCRTSKSACGKPRCPTPGKGAKRSEWDFSEVAKLTSQGRRTTERTFRSARLIS